MTTGVMGANIERHRGDPTLYNLEAYRFPDGYDYTVGLAEDCFQDVLKLNAADYHNKGANEYFDKVIRGGRG